MAKNKQRNKQKETKVANQNEPTIEPTEEELTTIEPIDEEPTDGGLADNGIEEGNGDLPPVTDISDESTNSIEDNDGEVPPIGDGSDDGTDLIVDSVPPKFKIPFLSLADIIEKGTASPRTGCNAQLSLLNSIEAELISNPGSIEQIFEVFKEVKDDVFPNNTIARWELEWPYGDDIKKTFNTFFVVLGQLEAGEEDTIDKDLVLSSISESYPGIKIALNNIL